MSLDIAIVPQLAPYDDEEEIQLMDVDAANLQLEEQSIHTTKNPVNQEEQDDRNNNSKIEKENNKLPSLTVIEKLRVYLRDGPNSHHVEVITVNEKYYELPTADQLESDGLTEQNMNDIWESLNLTKEDFRTSLSPSGRSRPESLYLHGVNNMSTQQILNCFEEFQPIGIEWICDYSCNIFWNDTLTPLHLLATKSIPGPFISRRRPLNFDHSIRPSKRKLSSSISASGENNPTDTVLPPGHWREGNFEIPDKLIKLYLRYATFDDRKVVGAENQSEYYRQHGNPNYNNMTGLISRSKKRALNAMKLNRFRDFTVVKSNNQTCSPDSIVEEMTKTADDHTVDAKVKFTVVLPPKKDSINEEDDIEGDHRSKRRRRHSSWNNVDDNREHTEKPHFTVTIDPVSTHTKNSRNKYSETSKSSRNDDNDHLKDVTDARQILENKRRNRK